MLTIKYNTSRLHLSGSLTLPEVEKLKPEPYQGVRAIDLSRITDFDSAGLAWLVHYFAPYKVGFSHAPSSLLTLSQLYGLDDLFCHG
ncbi:STAS domain-containing protein [Motilimonas pumila]|uniref:STAS domain-containing protein n=1 Tax=Motilimonas pumila TaxID=2303987 RepID=A0A418YI52_9GAMM|nr:hypothetical protein [Motilimonas pumila]RJG50009.1 hypothetical protein D1Z90_05020 [Motilimonas pumila]